MKLYVDYVKERLGRESIVIEDKAFITYEMDETECYVVDIYVRPDLRKTGIMAEISEKIEKIARDNGCKHMTGTVQVTANNSTNSLSYCLSLGYELWDVQGKVIIIKKEL